MSNNPEIHYYEELVDACAKLRESVVTDNPSMLGSPVEVVLQAKVDLEALKEKLNAIREILYLLSRRIS